MGRNRGKKDDSFSDGPDTRAECHLGKGECSNESPRVEQRFDRPEERDLRCPRVNDIGLLPNENAGSMEPDDIAGPSQYEFFDVKAMVGILVPQSSHNVIVTGFEKFVEQIRPREVLAPGYDGLDIAELAINARSARIYVNQLIRACRYAQSRLRHGWSEVRLGHLVGSAAGGDNCTGIGDVWYDLLEDPEWSDYHDAIYTAIEDFEDSIMYFDMPIITTDDEMFSEIYGDSCVSTSAFAFLTKDLPIATKDTANNKVTVANSLTVGFLDQSLSTVALLKTALTAAVAQIRTFIAMFRTPVANIIRRDAAISKGMSPQSNPFAVCIPHKSEFYGDGKGHMPVPTAIIAAGYSTKGSWANRLACATPAYLRVGSTTITSEVNFATKQTSNVLSATESLAWAYQDSPSVDQRGYKINTFGECLDRESRSSCSFFITPGTVVDSGTANHQRDITMQENRGYVILDFYVSTIASVNGRTATYSSEAKNIDWTGSANQTNAMNGLFFSLMNRIKTEELPEITANYRVGNTFGMANQIRAMRSDDPDWLRKRLIRAIQSDAARDAFLATELRDAIACEGKRVSDVTQ